MAALTRFLPFLRWFPPRPEALKADLVAGVSVALVLIPQSMAYAQLAGVPPYYGLYAAFLPVMVAAMWGSSAQLCTGPVAVVSLLTASSLAPLAAQGSETFIALAITVALMAGVIQLGLGLLKLGVVVNFLSHPVIVGFTNAAAIIIALSQISKLLGVSMGRSEWFIADVVGVLRQMDEVHVPTFLIGLGAIALMWGLRRFAPKLPGVLIAVVITTLVSWSIGFERNGIARIESIADSEVRMLAENFGRAEARIVQLTQAIVDKSAGLRTMRKAGEGGRQRIAALNYEIELLGFELKDAEAENRKRSRALRKFVFAHVPGENGAADQLHLDGLVPPGVRQDGHHWRVKKIGKGELQLVGGGEVVGAIPPGLPGVKLPGLNPDAIVSLLTAALVISMVGFMEAISIAKALASKTRKHIDPNQELLGQGLANLVGALTQSFPVSGSFSRSAVNFNAGAKTGMSSVVTGLVVMLTLLFLTPLLYHLPQGVLAAIIIMSVIGLVNFAAVRHAWLASKHDGAVAVVTFIVTLAFAPHLDNGIIVGAGLAVVLYLYRTMRPRVAILARHPDGTLRDIKVFPDLPRSEQVIALRFDGQLYFANVPYFEDAVLDAAAANPKAKYLLIVGDGINQLDASGEDVIHNVVQWLRDNGVTVGFSGLKKQVRDVMRSTGLYEFVGSSNLFGTEDEALEAISRTLGEEAVLPLLQLDSAAQLPD